MFEYRCGLGVPYDSYGGGFVCEFEAVRTVSSESSRDAVRSGSLKDQRPPIFIIDGDEFMKMAWRRRNTSKRGDHTRVARRRPKCTYVMRGLLAVPSLMLSETEISTDAERRQRDSVALCGLRGRWRPSRLT